VETKRHSSSITLKVLIRQTPPIIKKKGNTFEIGPTMCVSFANKGKTQVRWATHFSCFFKGVRPSFSGPTCYPHLFMMLGLDRSCISIMFLVGWSPYSYWCSGTCKDRYLSLLGRTIRYPCNVIEVVWSNVLPFKSLLM
jgi:hypothetical protein